VSAAAVERRREVIAYQQSGRMRLLPLALGSIALHVLVALVLAFVISRHLAKPPPPETLDLGIDVQLGEAVQELIAAAPTPEPAPPEPPRPTPVPEAPPPPPPEKPPDFVERKVELKPPPKVAAPRPVAAARATPPKGAKIGATPQAGVVGGNVSQGATSGTPGGQKVGSQGWRVPKPEYPAAALASHIQGSGEVRITTDAAGNVKDVVITRPIAPILDANTRSFARGNWKGPPNSTRTVPVVYQIR
jgi:protein TonB